MVVAIRTSAADGAAIEPATLDRMDAMAVAATVHVRVDSRLVAGRMVVATVVRRSRHVLHKQPLPTSTNRLRPRPLVQRPANRLLAKPQHRHRKASDLKRGAMARSQCRV